VISIGFAGWQTGPVEEYIVAFYDQRCRDILGEIRTLARVRNENPAFGFLGHARSQRHRWCIVGSTRAVR
jgi:hypothetical protein